VRTSAARAAVCLAVLALATAAVAHVVYQRQTLRQWAQQANSIAIAEIRSPLRVWSAADGSDHQEFFSVRIVEHLAGDSPDAALDVFPHAEGMPRYDVGDTVLLFLDRTAGRAEFANLAARFPFFTTQGAGHEWKIEPGDREVPSIALAWRENSGGGYATSRALLLRQLESAHPRMRTEAIGELVQLRASPAFRSDTEAHARMADMLRSDRLSVPERIGLIRVLEGVPGFSAAAALLALGGERLTPEQRVAVIRACGSVPGDGVTSWVRHQLREGDTPTRVAALLALGDLKAADAVDDIAAAATAADADPAVAHAAIRALGAIEGDSAVAALHVLAGSSRDSVGSLARAQLSALERRRTR